MTTTIDAIVRGIQRDLSPQFEERLRAELEGRDTSWLVDQIVRLTLDAQRLQEIDRAVERDAKAKARAERLARVAALALDEAALRTFIGVHGGASRDGLIASGHLRSDAPPKGTELLLTKDRTEAGEALLQHAKDVLFALLFGDESTGTSLPRTQHELLTFALPRFKASALDFMRAATELTAAGTWQDPHSVSNDERADNVLLEVQFGDTPEELVGNGVIACLGVINNLEVNEQVLYARMIDVEQTTLIT